MRMRLFFVFAMIATLAARVTAAERETSWIARADNAITDAQRSDEWTERKRLADEAMREAEKAAARDPKDPLPELMIAQALAISDPSNSAACVAERCPAALRALERAEKLDATGAYSERILAERGIVLSRLQRHVEALEAYDRALALISGASSSALGDLEQRTVLYGNSAETLMALGRLTEAIERYRRSTASSAQGDIAWQLANWGLAVALDRDGRVLESRAVVERVLETDPVMGSLHRTSVFFEPPGDEFYYRGLGHEIAGDQQEAVEAFTAFLNVLPRSRYAGRAKQHLAALSGARGAATKRGDRFEVVNVRVELAATGAAVRSNTVGRSVEAATRVVKGRAKELALCVERGERRNKVVGGMLVLRMAVASAGWVMQTAVTERDHEVPVEVARCIERSAMAWKFAAVDGSTPEIVGVGLLLR